MDVLFLGGDKRDRTADLLNAIQALSQLSYTPIFTCGQPSELYFSMSGRRCQQLFHFFSQTSDAGIKRARCQ